MEEISMRLMAYAVVLVAAASLAAPAYADASFQALSADAQAVVEKVTDGKPQDATVCAQGADQLRSDVIGATKSLYFSGGLAGSPKTAGTAAGDYLKALCQH